ncbi:MAG: hypothetical protein AB9M60_16525 [Leptothrix sp. (in: b-proteobacteria)]
MRHGAVFTALTLALLGTALSAPFEVNEDVMRDIEDVTKSLDSNVSLKQAKPAQAEVLEVISFFKQVEGYYAARADKPDAAGYARRAHELGAQIQQALDAGNYDAASQGVNALTRTCKTCHDAYK